MPRAVSLCPAYMKFANGRYISGPVFWKTVQQHCICSMNTSKIVLKFSPLKVLCIIWHKLIKMPYYLLFQKWEKDVVVGWHSDVDTKSYFLGDWFPNFLVQVLYICNDKLVVDLFLEMIVFMGPVFYHWDSYDLLFQHPGFLHLHPHWCFLLVASPSWRSGIPQPPSQRYSSPWAALWLAASGRHTPVTPLSLLRFACLSPRLWTDAWPPATPSITWLSRHLISTLRWLRVFASVASLHHSPRLLGYPLYHFVIWIKSCVSSATLIPPWFWHVWLLVVDIAHGMAMITAIRLVVVGQCSDPKDLLC